MWNRLLSSFLLILTIAVFTTADLETDTDNENEDDVKHKDHVWNYDKDGGPTHWGEMYSSCESSRTRQSPVNIETAQVVYQEDLKDLDIIYNNKTTHSMAIKSNGHTAQVDVEGDVSIIGGGLGGDVFKVVQFHFHWGRGDDKGSEHTMDGKAFPLEMHIVSFDYDRYTSITDALTGFNSLAVVGVLFNIAEEDNPVLAPIISALDKIKEPKSGPVAIDWIDPSSLLPGMRHHFYRYDGSLTTPTCLESVIWTVFCGKQNISSSQLAKFRELLQVGDDGTPIPLVDNFRPTQPLHERKVYASFIPEALRDGLDKEEQEKEEKEQEKDKEEQEKEEKEKEEENRASGITAATSIIISILIIMML